MTPFRKALRLMKKADKHYFRNCFTPRTHESWHEWKAEGVAQNTKKKLRKGNGPMLVAC
jgi:hypothetical protein